MGARWMVVGGAAALCWAAMLWSSQTRTVTRASIRAPVSEPGATRVVAGARDEASPRGAVIQSAATREVALEASNYKQRPPGEWEGMLVDLTKAPPCERSSDCQMALACVNGHCTACESASTCAAGETCVLDHCVLSELVACRSTRDCGERGRCLLSGYSNDLRGNGEMHAVCSGDMNFVTRPRPVIAQTAASDRTTHAQPEFERGEQLFKASVPFESRTSP
jgi:hypothetical protein